jgi:hypothetical protein
MRFKIEPNQINFDDMKSKLEANFPNYKFKVRTKNFLVASKSSTIGTNILLKNKALIVVGNLPSMGATFIFMLAIIFLGVLIPLIIYLAAFQGKMKKLEKEIADFLATTYNLKA